MELRMVLSFSEMQIQRKGGINISLTSPGNPHLKEVKI